MYVLVCLPIHTNTDKHHLPIIWLTVPIMQVSSKICMMDHVLTVVTERATTLP